MSAQRVLIKACLNGDRPRSRHAPVPLTPQEIAADARRAMEAGAGAAHVHPRRPDGTETLDPDDCDAVVAAIRASCPRLPVGLTTGAWIDCGSEGRLACIDRWSELPDFVSVNFSESGTGELCALLLDRAIGIEAGVQSPADVEALAAAGVAGNCTRVLVEAAPEDSRAAVELVAALDRALDAHDISAPRLYHGCEAATWAVLGVALARGDSVRVGLEDVTVLPDGTPAGGNADLIEAAVRMARESGLSVPGHRE